MFTISAQFEDLRIHATSDHGHSYTVQIEDAHSGEIADTITLSAQQLSYVFQFHFDPDGTPEGFEKMYEELEPIFKDWPINLRPIP